jgi:hypothetical protein
MAVFTLTPADLAPFATIDQAKAEAMIADAMALAVLVAPCLDDQDLSDLKRDAAKAIIRGAILRWNEAGTGALQATSQTAGPFATNDTFDTRQPRKAMYWPSEIQQLQRICKGENTGAYAIDTIPRHRGLHSLMCDLNFGGVRCSCGVSIAGVPIFEPEE